MVQPRRTKINTPGKPPSDLQPTPLTVQPPQQKAIATLGKRIDTSNGVAILTDQDAPDHEQTVLGDFTQSPK